MHQEQILQAVLPAGSDATPGSYTQVGHIGKFILQKMLHYTAYVLSCIIAHMNLKEEYYPWKQLIGQVILDVSQSCMLYERDAYIFSYRKTRISRV